MLVVGAAVFRQLAGRKTESQAKDTSQSAGTNSQPINPIRAPGPSVRLVPKVQESLGFLQTAEDSAAARQRLVGLRATLASMPVNMAVGEIRQFLDSKADAPTRLGFKVGVTGGLEEAPTLRTFLLNEMARLDPAAAAEYAKVILASKDSPDEWAVAQRNLAIGDKTPDGRMLLEQKASAMLQYEPWQKDPSVGFLEAFDVPVYLGGKAFMGVLSNMVRRQDDPAIAHAAYLALDRLVINDPVTMLGALADAPDLMQGRESTRANYFARADVRDPQQKQLLESYLLDPRIGPAEIATFAGVYPNANFMISPNLLTQTPTPDGAALTSRDAESLGVVQHWLADARFANMAPALIKITLRLQTFAQQAKQGR